MLDPCCHSGPVLGRGFDKIGTGICKDVSTDLEGQKDGIPGALYNGRHRRWGHCVRGSHPPPAVFKTDPDSTQQVAPAPRGRTPTTSGAVVS